MRILFLGDVVGPSGCDSIKKNLKNQIEIKKINFVIVNGENAADTGVGITEKISNEFFNSGIDVITTGKSSMECVKLINKFGGRFVGIACLIDRSKKSSISKKIISQVKLDIPVFKKDKLPVNLKNIQITKPGSRYLR